MADWILVDYQGKLAITLPWSADFDKPIEYRVLWVSPTEKWDEEWYKRFTQIRLVENNYFTCWDSVAWTSKPLYTHNWERVSEKRDVPPPGRGSKNFRWEWRGGRWTKHYL